MPKILITTKDDMLVKEIDFSSDEWSDILSDLKGRMTQQDVGSVVCKALRDALDIEEEPTDAA